MVTAGLQFLRGDVRRTTLLYVLCPLAWALMISGTLLAAGAMPGGYDWRYEPMSQLGSATRNSPGRAWWSVGLISFFVVIWPLTGYVARALRPTVPMVAAIGRSLLTVGYLAGIAVGIETLIFPGFGTTFRKAHEVGAIAAFASLYLGVATNWAATVRVRTRDGSWTLPAAVGVFLMASLPLTGAILSQAWLYFDPNRPGWVSREWEAMGIPLWLSFAFWEWLSFVALTLLLALVAAVVPPPPRRGQALISRVVKAA